MATIYAIIRFVWENIIIPGYWLKKKKELPFTRHLLGEGNGTPHQYFAWKIPWMEEPGRLQSTGSLRVGHDWVTSLSLFTFLHWRRKWQPLQCSCLENPRDGGAWWLRSMGSHRVRHDWSDLAAAAAGIFLVKKEWVNLTQMTIISTTAGRNPLEEME